MDLTQQKLSKAEWDSIEIPVSESDKEILQLISSGYANQHIKVNKINSILTFLKLDYSKQMEDFLYNKHFFTRIKNILETNKIGYIRISIDSNKFRNKRNKENSDEEEDSDDKNAQLSEKDSDNNTVYKCTICGIIKLKSSEQIRINRSDTINEETTEIYEYILLNHLEKLFLYKIANASTWVFHYYTLLTLMTNNINKVNIYIKQIINTILENIEKDVNLLELIKN